MTMMSTVMVTYRFRGYDYHVTLAVGEEKLKNVMTLEVEDDATADQWKGTFSADYIQDLTQKTGNYKQFDIFVSMIESALTKTSDSVTLDLLTYGDLQLLRNQKSTSQSQTSSETLNSKRYLILTYSVEFDRIHYPLPLPYLGKPDPVALLRTIRELRTENEDLRKRLGGENAMADQSVRQEYEKQLEDAITQNSELERANEELTNELSIFREGRASKELRMLKGVVQTMEEDLLKEKNRHQRSSAKSQQEMRRLKDQLEELKNAESDLKIRVRNLTTELSSYKRPGATFRSRASPSPQRASAVSRPSRPLSRTSQPRASSSRTSQPRASSHGRTPMKSSSTISHRSASSGARDRSISAGDRPTDRRAVLGLVGDKLETRRRSASGGGRALSKERWVAPPTASSASILSGGKNQSQSRTRLGSHTNQSEARIRYRSPSPTPEVRTNQSESSVRYRGPSPTPVARTSTSSLKRFDPTDYVRQKKEKERESRNSVEKKYKLGGGIGKEKGGGRSNSRGGGASAVPSHPPRGLLSASPEERNRKGRTSSGESVATASRSSSMESLNSQRSFGANNKLKRIPLRQSNDRPTSNNTNDKLAKNKSSGSIGAKWKSAEKENLASSTAPESSAVADESLETVGDVTGASLPVDPDEMEEIDARLNALQNFMKSMGHD